VLIDEVYEPCTSHESGSVFLIFPILPNVIPHIFDAAHPLLQLFSTAAFILVVVLALVLWWPRKGNTCCLDQGLAEDHAAEFEDEETLVAASCLPFRELGARTTAYIPLTVRGHSGLMGANELRAIQVITCSTCSKN
jgi:hypothetical protein